MLSPGQLHAGAPQRETLSPTCAKHLEGWRAQIIGEYEALPLTEWEARGCGYRGAMLGG